MSGAPPRADAPPKVAVGEAPPRGPPGRFPHPRARYLASAPPRRSLGACRGWTAAGAGRRFKDSGGSMRPAGGARPGGGLAPPGREFLHASPWTAAARAGPPRGQPCRGGVPLPPPLRGPVSAERPRRRSAVSGLPASKRAAPGAGSACSPAGAAGPRGGDSPGGRGGRRASVAALRRAALRFFPFPAPASARRSPAASRRPGRHPGSSGGGVARRAWVCRRAPAARRGCPGPGPARRFVVALRRPRRAGLGGRAGASHSRSPRGNGESGRRLRLSAVRLPLGACRRGGQGEKRRRRFRAGGRRVGGGGAPSGGAAGGGVAGSGSGGVRLRRGGGAAEVAGGAEPGGGKAAAAARRERARRGRARAGGRRGVPPAPGGVRFPTEAGQAARPAASVPPRGGRAEPGRLGRPRSERGAFRLPRWPGGGARAPP